MRRGRHDRQHLLLTHKQYPRTNTRTHTDRWWIFRSSANFLTVRFSLRFSVFHFRCFFSSRDQLTQGFSLCFAVCIRAYGRRRVFCFKVFQSQTRSRKRCLIFHQGRQLNSFDCSGWISSTYGQICKNVKSIFFQQVVMFYGLHS